MIYTLTKGHSGPTLLRLDPFIMIAISAGLHLTVLRYATLVAALLLFHVTRATTNTFVCLDSQRIDRLAERIGVSGNVWGVARNQSGTQLRLTIPANPDPSRLDGYFLGILSERGVELKRIPHDAAEVDESGRPICFYKGVTTNRYFAFAGGASLPHVDGSIIRFSPDTAFFFISGATPTNRARVFRTADPINSIIYLPERFNPQKIFSRAGEICVFGQKRKADAGPGDRSTCWGLVYSCKQDPVTEETEIDLSRFGTVLDMDQANSVLLVDSKRDVFRTWGLYYLTTHKYKSLGQVRGRGFFLNQNFAGYLETLWEAPIPNK